MTLDDLLNKFARAGQVFVRTSSVRLGNHDNTGNYRIVSITTDQETIRFRELNHTWSAEISELANQLQELHNALESGDSSHEDCGLARGLEDALGSGQHVPTQVEDARKLLSKYGRSLGW